MSKFWNFPTIASGGLTKLLEGFSEGINWLGGMNKNKSGRTMWQQLGNWFKNTATKVVGHGNTNDVTDVMDENGNFVWTDNATGLTKLWNDLTGTTQRNYTTAQNNWTTQYNSPTAQKERLLSAGQNPNLATSNGLFEATPNPVSADNSWNGLTGIGQLLQGIGSVPDYFQDRKAKALSNKNASLKNIADEANLPPSLLNKAIREAQNDPTFVQEAVRQLLQKQNISGEALMNDGFEQGVRKDELQLRSMLTAIESAFAEDDMKEFTETNPYSDTGKLRLNAQGRQARAQKRDAESAEWLLKVAEKVKAKAEEKFAEGHEGNYPSWGVDMLDDKTTKMLIDSLNEIDNPLVKGLVTALTFVVRKKL